MRSSHDGVVCGEAGLHGAEGLGTADEAVEVIGLPEGIQGAEAGFVDQTARNAFPALERVGEGLAVAEGEERMDLIGHDDVAPEVVALAVEVMEAVGDDLGEAWITQGTVGTSCVASVMLSRCSPSLAENEPW